MIFQHQVSLHPGSDVRPATFGDSLTNSDLQLVVSGGDEWVEHDEAALRAAELKEARLAGLAKAREVRAANAAAKRGA